MAEYIKREDAYDVACAECEAGTFYDIPSKIEAIPAADVVPRENYESMEQTVFKLTEALAKRKHGKWKDTLQGWKCSACHKEQDYSVYFDFCPNCGARMTETCNNSAADAVNASLVD